MKWSNVFKHKVFKSKSARIIWKSLLGIFVFVYLLVASLNTTSFQTALANFASNFFSQQWNTQVRISALSIDVFRGVKVYDVYLEDQNGDTILAANSIRVAFDYFPFHNGLNLRNVSVNDITFNLRKKDGKLNFYFIIDYFKSKKEKEKKKKEPFIVNVQHLSMKNVTFLLDVNDADTPMKDGLFNGKYEKYSNINAEISNIKVIKDSVLCDIEHFEAKERSGFVLTNLKGKVTSSPSLIRIKDMALITPYTEIYADCELQATNWKTYKYYMDSVKMDVTLKEGTLLGGKDATYWAETMQGFSERFYVSGKVKGTTANMRIDDLDVRNNNTHIAADGLIKGLPKIDKTYFDMAIRDLSSSYAELSGFSLGNIGEKINLPEMLANIGQFSLNSNIKGTLKEFDAKAFLVTEAGSLDLIAQGRYDETTQLTAYTADLNSVAFNAGRVLGNDMFGTTDLNAKVSLIGTDFKKNMNGNLTADLHYATIKGNVYDVVTLNGNVHNGKIDATMQIEDKDIGLNAVAQADLSNGKQIQANITADIDNAHVSRINFFSFYDTNAVVSAKITAEVRNMDIKQLDANADIAYFEVKNTQKDFKINNIHLAIVPLDSVNKALSVRSDVLDCNIDGRFELNEIGQDFSNVINYYLPDFKDAKQDTSQANKVIPKQNIKSDISFDAKLKQITPLLNLFVPSVTLDEYSYLSGRLNNEQKLQIDFTSKELKISSIRLENLNLTCNDNKNALAIAIQADSCFLSDSLYMPLVNGNINAGKEKITLALQFDDKQDKANQLEGNINLNLFINGRSMQGNFENSYLQLLNKKININGNNLINYNGEKFSLMNLVLSNNEESIKLEGDISKSIEESLKVNFHNLDISLLNPMLKEAQTTLEGRLNESITIKALLDKPVFTSSLRVDDLRVNDVVLGYAWLNVNNAYGSDKLYTDIKLLKQDSNQVLPLQIKGYVNLADTNQALDLSLAFQNFDLRVIQRYLSKFSSRFEGNLYANNIKIQGSFKQPKIAGNIFVNTGSIKIDMLNTTYFFNDTIRLSDNTFAFNNFLFRDEQQNRIVLNGSINHNQFKDYNIHLTALADKIRILNTKASTNSKYYGTAYASAFAKLDGDLNRLNIDIKAKTEKGTMLTVPVSSKMSAKENEFITFVSYDTSAVAVNTAKTGSEGMKINLAMDLHVTPDAQINVPMDFKEIAGDLSASPSGDLKIDLDDNGQIRMDGKVDIDNGNFSMGLLSAIERTFVLQKGGSIQFTGGSPSDARIDIKAIYKTKASLAILGDDYKGKKANVDCIVNLSGILTDPTPTFDLQLPNTDQQTTDQLFNVLNLDRNNSESMFMQVAFLMISNGFYQSGGDYATGFNASYVENSAFDALFSQVNNKVSDLLGIDFSSGLEISDDETTGNSANFGGSKSFGKWTLNFSSSIQTQSQQTENSDISALGTFEGSVEYRLSDNVVIHGYNKSNKDNFEKNAISPYTQGIGVQYRKQYRRFADIFGGKNKSRQK
ncbi:MAG: translocation/assembly module TamB [Bacteroidales bacterium]|jgi:hypothetical protein|nr:translocation/assembly module TamB [Bacteroidales bacterium]